MIGVDWGTTQLRAYQIDSRGAVLAFRCAPKGILSVSDGDFAGTLESVIRDWLNLEREPILMSGMIGSRQGWLEVPYVTCPATAVDVAKGLVLLRHTFWRVDCVARGVAQHGHLGSVLTIAAIIEWRTVAIESGIWRWGLSGGSSGSVTGG